MCKVLQRKHSAGNDDCCDKYPPWILVSWASSQVQEVTSYCPFYVANACI